MHELIIHPSYSPGPILSIDAAIHPTDNGCEAQFRVEGAIEEIHIPPHAEPARTDDLWKTTCFEVFCQPEGGARYREFNLSPSRLWAAYDFDDVRLNSHDAQVDAIEIECKRSDTEVVLTAKIVSALDLPAKVALNAVIETSDGKMQFWALAFDKGKPDFHREACRTLNLAGRL